MHPEEAPGGRSARPGDLPDPHPPEDAGPALHEERSPRPRGAWLLTPGIFAILEGGGVLFAPDPLLSLGPAAIGAAAQAAETFTERSYRWRVTSRHLVHGRLRWPFLRGGGRVALGRISAVQTTSARSRWGIKRAVDMGGDDVGRVPRWTRGAVIVHVDVGQPGAHRVIIGTSTAAGAEETARVLRAASGVPEDPPQPSPTQQTAHPPALERDRAAQPHEPREPREPGERETHEPGEREPHEPGEHETYETERTGRRPAGERPAAGE